MNLKTLLNKTTDTVKLIMTQPTMIFRNKEDVVLLNSAHVVDADESARPDLIALKHYGDQSKLDMILKWNGISDPFSINKGDILEIPSANTNFFKLERPKEFENNPVKQQFIDGKRLSKKDQRRLNALKKKYGKDNLLPPNVIPVGKKNYEFIGSKIRMGAQAQTDPVVNGININLEADDTSIDTSDLAPFIIESENIGDKFKKIPGGVWTWTGSEWLSINPDIAQEVAGSLYDSFGNPNGNIVGSFESQFYFDRVEPVEIDNTASASSQGADIVGDNQNDGSNPAGDNTNNSSNTSTCE